MKIIKVGNISIGRGRFCFIGGPCVIENEKVVFKTAEFLKNITETLGIPFIFKSSYDKANRSSIDSFRGVGLKKGMEIFSELKKTFNIPVITDVHCVAEIPEVSSVVDIIQVPAFLCRQTELIVNAAKTRLPVNVKKGQFMAPWETKNIIEKILSAGNDNILLTERGTSFGYNNLVVDFRSLPIMKDFGYPVIFDGTHSVQQPGGLGKSSGGQRQFVEPLCRAAIAVGCNGIFLEVHPHPEKALSDGPNMLSFEQVEPLLKTLKEIEQVL
ncbi:MAG: 3-deoxy-8-phosphooctulonate synthase [Candidatus Omnitrophica bacterium]|nr:3-deoxy-8-phosphooctulonate synthase [Candidatus Omnitrophota bacterium]